MRVPKLNAGGKSPVARLIGFLSDYKRNIIITAIILAACGSAAFAANYAKTFCYGMEYESAAAAADIRNEIDNMRQSHPMYTDEAVRKDYTDVQINWLGTKIDAGRWMADENIFWDFISPAFNFKSATEYNKMREDYILKVGNCLFTVQFLSYYDIESRCRRDENGNVNQVDFERYDAAYTCSSSKSAFRTYPVGVDANGDYRYVALVPMQGTYVMFTYKIVHAAGQGGRERITLAEFDCWPPNSGKRMNLFE